MLQRSLLFLFVFSFLLHPALADPPAPPRLDPAGVPGTLILTGDMRPSEAAKRRFLELAGGAKARIVVITSNERAVADELVAEWKAGKAADVNLLPIPIRRLEKPEEDKAAITAATKGVSGVWLLGTPGPFLPGREAFRDVLRRGGVIGGSSAGATIQGDYLCRGSPLNNTDFACEGYERGLGFLPGVAIDQHFTQRKRHPDMTALMKLYPQFLGIGLDEATAIIVRGSVAEVKGKGKAHFYDTKRKTAPGEPDFEALAAGGRYDLKARQILPDKKE